MAVMNLRGASRWQGEGRRSRLQAVANRREENERASFVDGADEGYKEHQNKWIMTASITARLGRGRV